MKYSVLLSKHVPAMTQSASLDLRKLNGCWSGKERSWEWALMIEGLLYKVNTNAPTIDIMLPITLAWLLLLLAAIFSILKWVLKRIREKNKWTIIDWDIHHYQISIVYFVLIHQCKQKKSKYICNVCFFFFSCKESNTIRKYTFNIGYLEYFTSVLKPMLKVPMLNVSITDVNMYMTTSIL